MMIEKWEIQYGDKTVPVTAEDVAETMGRMKGIVNYYLETNSQIKGNVQMRIIHDLDIEIVDLVRRMFLGFAEKLAKGSQPKMTTVKKIRR